MCSRSLDKNAYVIEITDGELQKYSTGVVWSSPVLTENALLFGSLQGHIYYIDLRMEEDCGNSKQCNDRFISMLS
ncbi:MAG: hypothetical protein QXU32_11790 [Nitrososphaerales archaeon]